METTTFFPGASRRIILGSPTKQASNGRICMSITMPLTGEAVVGMPDWLGIAFDQVSKHFTSLKPEIEQISDLVVCFDNSKPNGKLFADPSAKIPSAELKGFEVLRAGEADEPDVELHFKLYAPFQREFWRWVGEMAGNEAYMGFPKGLGVKVVPPEQDPLPNLAKQYDKDEPSEAETDALAGDENPPPDEPAAKRKGRGKAAVQ